MLQRIVLYSTLGVLLNTLAITFDTWSFWCVVGLFWASDQISRLELIDELNQELKAIRRRYNKDSNDNNNT